jgi:signal transduction histidine kinase
VWGDRIDAQPRFLTSGVSLWSAKKGRRRRAVLTSAFFVKLTTVFLAYFVAGKLGQATTSIRSSNLGPVWPAYGIALASLLAYGIDVWPGIAASAFVVAISSVSPLAALGQASGATLAAATGTIMLRRIPKFDPSLSRLRDALGLIVLGAFGSALLSSSIGILSLYATGIQPYSGLRSAWLIYWLGDSTGVLLVTPLVFTLPGLWRLRSRKSTIELAALLTLLTGACFVIFGDLPLIPIRLDVLAFAVLPFVMWGAINFRTGGATLSVFLIASLATVLTALGSGPFAGSTPFVNAALLDLLFAVLAVSGLTLAAVITERETALTERGQQKRVEDALSSVNRKLIEAQERERTRVSRELHDDIGQRLALLTVRLAGLALSASESGADRSQAIELQKFASSLAQDVQALSHELHSPKLAILGVATSMRLFCTEFATQQGVTINFESQELPPTLSSDIALCLYRILQEALHNAVKHSGVHQFEVRVWLTRRDVHLEVSDDGVGFEVRKALESPGLGLVSMEERAKLVAGDLEVFSAPQRGTTVHARVPLNS